MHISDFFDVKLLENIMKDWSLATGMATIAVDNNGKYITSEIGFTDFCIKYTRGSKEGARRCIKCDNECSGTYFCHAGLMDFNIEINADGHYLGRIIGGQILPGEPDEEKFRTIAGELGINPDRYIEALRKVPVKSEQGIRSAARLLGEVVNMLVNFEYTKAKNTNLIKTVEEESGKSSSLLKSLTSKSSELDKIESKQKMLSLNASIEAARANEYGRGFAVVADEVGKLAASSGQVNQDIKELLKELTESVDKMNKAKIS